MESVSGIHKPTMGVNHSSTVRSPVPEGQSGLVSSSMKNTSMVSNVVVTSGGVSIPSTNTQGGGMSGTPTSFFVSGEHSSVGRMAYIREGWQKEELSEQASSLVLASWRSKSNSNYKSLFHKWECWCHSKDRSPILVLYSITDVLNFVWAKLPVSFHKFLPFVHLWFSKVEGHQIGQHPMVLQGVFNSR